MKKLIAFIIFILYIMSFNGIAQDKLYLTIPENGIDMNEKAWRNLEAIYNLDVFDYYELYNYDTELKQKVFLESSEGQGLTEELRLKKEKLLNSVSYFPFQFDGKYNLSSKTFDISMGISFMPISGYMNLSDLAIKKKDITKQFGYYTSDVYRVYGVPAGFDLFGTSTIQLPMTEMEALRVENDIRNLVLVVEFKMEGMKESLYNAYLGTLVNFYIIDGNTREIYYSLDKNKIKELKAKQEEQQQLKLAQEQERQRQIEEQQRKEREEAERKARERRSKINVFLAERTDTTYSIESANRSKYNQDKELLSKAIASAVEQFNPQDLDLTVKDSVYIDFMGHISHTLAISGTPEISGLENAVRKQIEQSRISPMSIKVPGTDTTCTVSSADFYLLDYKIFTESSALNLKKTKSAVSVKSGDRQFYQNNKSGIDTYLSKGNGIYKVNATVKNTNGKRNTEVSISKFRNTNPAYTIGYHYTPFAPVGFAFGINNIRNSNWGAFIKLGGKTASSPEGDIYEVPEYSNKYVGGFYLTLGTTCSISKYGYLYAGIGGANRADKNVWQEGSIIHRDVRNTGGFNIEAGVIIRPVKWVGVSVGYNYIAGKSSYGGINIGAVLFLQKGDFR